MFDGGDLEWEAGNLVIISEEIIRLLRRDILGFNGLLIWDKCCAAITMIYRDCFDHCMISMIRSGVS